MALTFRKTSDGYRAIRVVNDTDVLVAVVETKRHVSMPISDANKYGAAEFHLRPKAEWTVHSAIGPMTFADLLDIMQNVPKD